ncbi:MAG: ABC transporter permease [Candidatus Bathyarchaeia archaeon]
MSLQLCLKALFRRVNVARSIIAIALLVAILASVSSVVSFLRIQTEALAGLAHISEKYFILNGASLTESMLDAQLAKDLSSLPHLKNVVAEKTFWSNMKIGSISREVLVRGVGDVKGFLEARRAHMNGSAAKSINEVNMGELAARLFSVDIGENVYLAFGTGRIEAIVTGIFRTRSELDSEIVMPMEAAFNLTGEDTISLIEFSFKEHVDVDKALKEIEEILPDGAIITQAQQTALFIQQINTQTLNFLSAWSLAVYAAVASASYVITARLVQESGYEILMLRALGAREAKVFHLIIVYIVVVAVLGSILGVALGLVGAQVASAILAWLVQGMQVTPLLEISQFTWILLLTMLSAFIGCVHPAYGATKVKYEEKQL